MMITLYQNTTLYCRCQEVLLDSMQMGENIARNAALRENVFMMVICIELRIPLFLVGKPGSSKSLAKAIISDSMRGKNSKNDLLKKFKDVSYYVDEMVFTSYLGAWFSFNCWSNIEWS